MAKTKDLTVTDLNEGYDKLELEDKIAHFIHVKADIDAEKKRKGEELDKLNKLEYGK